MGVEAGAAARSPSAGFPRRRARSARRRRERGHRTGGPGGPARGSNRAGGQRPLEAAGAKAGGSQREADPDRAGARPRDAGPDQAARARRAARDRARERQNVAVPAGARPTHSCEARPRWRSCRQRNGWATSPPLGNLVRSPSAQGPRVFALNSRRTARWRSRAEARSRGPLASTGSAEERPVAWDRAEMPAAPNTSSDAAMIAHRVPRLTDGILPDAYRLCAGRSAPS